MKKLKAVLARNHSALHFIRCYTLLFACLTVITFGFFWFDGKTLVWKSDGFTQHYKAMLYYAQWMREIIRGILCEGNLSIPTFSLSFGLGSDLFTTLQYYVIGDPLTLPAVLVPTRYMIYYYEFAILLRVYLAGLSFAAFCFHHNKTRNAVLAGAVAYSFCSFMLFAAVRHPYFSNPLIYFPLLLLGAEKIKARKSPWLFVGMVAISAMSNFYFFYMLVILVIIYVVIDVIMMKPATVKEKIGILLRTAGYSVIGLLLSGVYFAPVVRMFLSDSRLSFNHQIDTWYSLSYYEKILEAFITGSSPGNWSYIGVSAVVMLALILFFIRRDSSLNKWKATFILLFTVLLIPYCGHVFNGFSYTTNRWCWGFVFLLAFILTEMWENFFELTRREFRFLLCVLVGYFFLASVAFWNISENFYFSWGLAMAGASLLLFHAFSKTDTVTIGQKSKRWAERLLFLLLIAGIGGNAFYMYSPYQGNYTSEFMERSTFQKTLESTEGEAILSLNDKEDFYRYSGTTFVRNASILNGLSNTQYLWSLNNGYIVSFYDKNLIAFGASSLIDGQDSRTATELLSSTKYFVTKSSDYAKVPYGYTHISETEVDGTTYHVYENQYALPLGFTFSNYMTEAELSELLPLQRQEAMLQSVVLEDMLSGYNHASELSLTGQTVEYEIKADSNKVTLQEDRIVVTDADQTVTLTFRGQPNCETYLAVNNLHYTGVTKLQLYNDDESIGPQNLYSSQQWDNLTKQEQISLKLADLRYSEPTALGLTVSAKKADGGKASNTLRLMTPRYARYSNRHDFLVNLYYSKSPLVSITIKFPQRGIYTYDSIEVLCQPMENIENQTEALKVDVLENLNLHENAVSATNQIEGTIFLEESKILCLSIPYSEGWTAYVDGVETELLKANLAYMAIPLDAGEHEIALHYQTPWLKAGGLMTLLGVLLAAVVYVTGKRRTHVNCYECISEHSKEEV